MSMTEAQPSQSLIISSDGKPVDPGEMSALDITNKSITELRAMGFESVLDTAVRNDSRSRHGAPSMSPEENQRMEVALQGLSMMRGGLKPNQEVPSGYFSNDEEDPAYI